MSELNGSQDQFLIGFHNQLQANLSGGGGGGRWGEVEGAGRDGGGSGESGIEGAGEEVEG